MTRHPLMKFDVFSLTYLMMYRSIPCLSSASPGIISRNGSPPGASSLSFSMGALEHNKHEGQSYPNGTYYT
jgi:hypothetical protein